MANAPKWADDGRMRILLLIGLIALFEAGCMDGFRINTEAEQKAARTNINNPKPGVLYIDDGSGKLREVPKRAPSNP